MRPERLLSIILKILALGEASASLTLGSSVKFLSVMEELVDLVPLHELAHPSEIHESKVALAFPIKKLEARINVILRQVCTQSLRARPEVVLVHSARLIVLRK